MSDDRGVLLQAVAAMTGLAEHIRDVETWWMTSYGQQDREDRKWCRQIAYERWVNGKPLLTEADPPVPWYQSRVEASGG